MGADRERTRRPLRGVRTGSALAVLVAVAVVGAAVASGLRHDTGSAAGRPDGSTTVAAAPGTTTAHGPTALDRLLALPRPWPGRLRGRLAVEDGGCRLSVIDLASGAATRPAGRLGVRRTCDAVLSPNGRYVAFYPDPTDGGPLMIADLVRATTTPAAPADAALGVPAVADDGRVAVCVDGRVVRVVAPQRPPRSVTGCRPVYAGSRLLVVRDGVVVDAGTGRRVAAPPRTTPPVDVDDVGVAAARGGRLLAVHARGPTGVADVTLLDGRGSRLGRGRIDPNGRIEQLRLGPDGDAAAFDVTGTWGLRHLHGPVSADVFAGEAFFDVSFAPDGRHVAVVTGRRLVVADVDTFGPLTAEPVPGLRHVTWLTG